MVQLSPICASAAPALRAGLVGAVLFVLGACASPNIQHAVMTAVDRDAEPNPSVQHALAEQARDGIASSLPRSANSELEARLTGMAQRLGNAADPQGQFSFEVVLLTSDRPMVFSAGDGTLYVTTRAAELLLPEADQMAFAMAHEIAHVVRGDAVEGFEADADPSSEAIRVADRGYAPHVESLADELALRYLSESGHDPALGARALSTVTRHQRQVDRFGSLMHGTAARKRERLSLLKRNVPGIDDPRDTSTEAASDRRRALSGENMSDEDLEDGEVFPELAP